jgi:hypothetical protein
MNYYMGASKLIGPGLDYQQIVKDSKALKARMEKVPCK